MNKEKLDKFRIDFKNKYPQFEILEFKNLNSPIVFKDSEGYIHKKNIAFKCISHGVRVDSIVDKENYVSEKLKKIFPNLKVIEFTTFKGKITVQDENGFEYKPNCSDLLNGHPVSIQTCTQKEKLFVFKANIKHNNCFEYLPFKYINGKNKINIKCKIHGIFSQTIETHLEGSGCRKCGCVGFSKESWLKRLKNKECIFYILEMFNRNEKFLKVGITSKSVLSRYSRLENYKYKILFETKNNPSNIYDLEKSIMKNFKTNKFYPKKPFPGRSECFNLDCYKQIIKFINKTK
jgi:hypothetical protein